MAKTEIRELEESDLPELARFYAAQGGAATAQTERGEPVAHLRWFLFENPERVAGVPRGWVARGADGRIAGAKYCAPQRFVCDGREVVVLVSGGYYVDAAHRGLGLLLMRRFLGVGERHAHVATTMNEVSGAIYERYGGYAIPRTERELLGVLRWPPLVEELLARRRLPGAAARLASRAAFLRPSAVRRGDAAKLCRVTSTDEIEAAALEPLPELGGRLTALRSREFLRWRYFAGPDATRALWVYRGTGGSALVGVNQRRRGHAGQIRTLAVLDLWGSLPLAETPALLGALAAHYADRVDLLSLRGVLPEREAVLRGAGCVSRDLPRATGVCIDPAGLLPTRDWYLVPADGDTGH